jgi:hypothetical protein
MKNLIIIILIFQFIYIKNDNIQVDSQRSFQLSPGIINRKVTTKLGKVTCDFKFSTKKCKGGEKKQIIKKLDHSIIKSLNGECLTRREGYWEYRICIGDKIRQFHQNEEYFFFNVDIFWGFMIRALKRKTLRFIVKVLLVIIVNVKQVLGLCALQ